jgi:lipid-A-disaccharide synthase
MKTKNTKIPPGKPVRIGIVAGEVSGDVLGAGLIRELKKRLPDVQFVGIGGPRMQRDGCTSWYPMDTLTVMGFEAFERLPQILRIRRELARRMLADPPDLFIGIDAPDFNLGLEQQLRAGGIRTVHYVSPTVWAWRRWRIHKIRRAVDHMLALFPFEERYYQEQGVPVTFVGHPLADVIPLRYDQAAVRRELGLPLERPIIALLPGSRMSELRRHADLFVRAAQWLHERYPALHFVAPFASEQTKACFEQALARNAATALPITVQPFRSREAMGASDIVLCASGTATLEAALLGKPMVVTYRISPFTAWLVRPMLHVKLYSLPNNLAGRALVPELIQDDATPEKLGQAVARLWVDTKEAGLMRRALIAIHKTLRRNANVRAAQTVIALLPGGTRRRRKAA